MNGSSGSSARSRSRVPSVEPSSTTIQRAGGCCLRRHCPDDGLDVVAPRCAQETPRGCARPSPVKRPSTAGTCAASNALPRAFLTQMCGICGMAARDPRSTPIGVPALRAMTEAIIHRGPDDDGHHTEPGVALGMRRLSIIDVEGSPQPRDQRGRGDVQAVFNGEIYNFRELRDELAARGHRFATSGDSETIVHLYEEFGPRLRHAPARHVRHRDLGQRRGGDSCLRATGWASSRCTAAETPNGLAFASEVKSLIAGGARPTRARSDGRRALPGARLRARPAHACSRACASCRRPRCWSGRTAGSPRSGRTGLPTTRPPPIPVRAGRRIRRSCCELLREAVRARMVCRRPARGDAQRRPRLEPDHRADGRVLERPGQDLFDRVRRGPRARTSSTTRAASRNRLGTEHHELTTSAIDHPDLLDEALWHLEEPVADVSCLGFLLLAGSRAAT